MKEAKNIKEFCHGLLSFAGVGYEYIKIVRIPPKKLSKIDEIRKKVSEHYKTDLTRSARYYRKKRGIANYGAVSFRDIIVILRTPGENKDAEGEFIKLKKRLKIPISEHLTLILFRDNRNRLTFRIDKKDFQRIKADFYEAIKNRDGWRYNTLKKMWYNLPYYKGIGRQGSDLHRFIKKHLKAQRLGWKPLYGS